MGVGLGVPSERVLVRITRNTPGPPKLLFIPMFLSGEGVELEVIEILGIPKN